MRFFHMPRGFWNRGSSLVELSVVVMITIILSSIVFVGLGRTSRNYTALYVEQAKIAELILRAKSLAISTYNIPPVPCGYGVRVDNPLNVNRSYALVIYDIPSDDPRCVNIATLPIDASRIRVFQENGVDVSYKLPSGIVFGVSPSPDPILRYVIFVPPDPNTYLYGFVLNSLPSQTGSRVVSLRVGSITSPTRLNVAVSVAGQLTFPP